MVTAHEVLTARAPEAAHFPRADHADSLRPQALEDPKRQLPEMPRL